MPSQTRPGVSRRYGTSPRWRWIQPKLGPDQALPLLQVVLVVQRLAVEDDRLPQGLVVREDQRIVGQLRVDLPDLLLRALDRGHVVDVHGQFRRPSGRTRSSCTSTP